MKALLSGALWGALFSWGAIVALGAQGPQLTLTPVSGPVSGIVSLVASASAAGVAKLQFLVNGKPFGAEIASGSCSLPWNTAALVNGSYVLGARGTKEDGTTVLAPVSTVIVANVVTPPPVVIPPVVTPPPQATGTITATPNPCQIAAGQGSCASTIAWMTAGATDAAVFVTPQNAAPILMGCGLQASSTVPWIGPQPVVFTLHAVSACTGATPFPSAAPLASVTVVGLAPIVVPPPPPVPSVVFPMPTYRSATAVMAWTIPTSPDGTTGWTMRLRRNSANIGTTTSATVTCGQSGYTWRWSKSGQANRDSSAFTATCP